MTTAYTCIRKIIAFYYKQNEKVQETIHDDIMIMIDEICKESDYSDISLNNYCPSSGEPFTMPLTYASNHK